MLNLTFDEKIKTLKRCDVFILNISLMLECTPHEGATGDFKFVPAGTILEILGTVKEVPVPNKIAWAPQLNMYILLRHTLGLHKLSK